MGTKLVGCAALFACAAAAGWAGCAIESSETLGRDVGDALASDASGLPDEASRGDGGLGLGLGDGRPSVELACEPGTYAGTFKTLAEAPGSDGGTFLLTGSLSIALTAIVTTSNGGATPQTMFAISSFSGTDVIGGELAADAVGYFSCESRELVATLVNGTYIPLAALLPDGSIPLNLPLNGTISATYDGTTAPPLLRDGLIRMGADPLFHNAAGSWTAALR